MQTTIPFAEDNWHIGRFSMLRDQLSSLKDKEGNPLCVVTTRNRESDAAGNDPVLSTLDRTEFDELWLFAIDLGDGLSVLLKSRRVMVTSATRRRWKTSRLM